MDNGSRLNKGFYRLSREERLERVKELTGLNEQEIRSLAGEEVLPASIADHLIENFIGYFQIPMGVVTHFVVDGKEILLPYAVEETSIIAAASSAAKWVKNEGQIRTEMRGSLIIGQIQIPSLKNATQSIAILSKNREDLIDRANACIPGLVARGGGVRDLVMREIERSDQQGKMLVLHVLCDPCDAMGANLINQVCETLKPHVELLTGEKVGLCILSNLVDTKLAVAEVVIRNIDADLGHAIQEASIFAESDPYRAATHNKGVMNGIDPILIATGNDWRAVEAGVHAYACRTGRYQPVTRWVMRGADLVGTIEIPLAVGTVGGVTRIHPTARVALKMMGIEHADDLARICAASGLVQNLGALRALVTVGIVKGHMQLHASNLAIAAGAEAHEVERVRERLGEILKTERSINLSHAKQVLEGLRGP